MRCAGGCNQEVWGTLRLPHCRGAAGPAQKSSDSACLFIMLSRSGLASNIGSRCVTWPIPRRLLISLRAAPSPKGFGEAEDPSASNPNVKVRMGRRHDGGTHAHGAQCLGGAIWPGGGWRPWQTGSQWKFQCDKVLASGSHALHADHVPVPQSKGAPAPSSEQQPCMPPTTTTPH